MSLVVVALVWERDRKYLVQRLLSDRDCVSDHTSSLSLIVVLVSLLLLVTCVSVVRSHTAISVVERGSVRSDNTVYTAVEVVVVGGESIVERVGRPMLLVVGNDYDTHRERERV